MKNTAQTLDNSTLAARHLVALSRGKTHYKKADAAIDALMKQAKAGEIFTLGDRAPIPTALRGKKFKLVDKFANRNSIGVGLSARRYELEELIQP